MTDLGRVSLDPMPETELAAWATARSEAGDPLPTPGPTETHEALRAVIDGTVAGGVLLAHHAPGGHATTEVRQVHTPLPVTDTATWTALIAALEDHAQRRGTRTLVVAVPPALVAGLQDRGWTTTLARWAKRLDPAGATELQDDRRVALRPMTDDERARFAAEAGEVLRAGMLRAGVLVDEAAPVGALEQRLAGLGAPECPVDEVLLTAEVDGVEVGRAWLSLVRDGEAVDVHGQHMELYDAFRGQRLTPSLVGALRRVAHEHGARDVQIRVYGHARGAHATYRREGAHLDLVHLRRELD
ncbi:MAG: hypothetical protein CMH83_07730 [Nocardioides sp.]|nr:hypothetical protein [Nocardioides sp.]